MTVWVSFGIGLLAGAVVGMVLTCLIQVGRAAKEEE